MATCDQCSDLLWDHLYGLLDAEQAQGLRDHLAECPSCRAAMAEAEAQQRLVAQAARVYDHVTPFVAPEAETAPAPTTLPLPVQPPRRPRRWPWVAAAASILLAVGGYVWYQRALADQRDEGDSSQLALAQTDQRITQVRQAVALTDRRMSAARLGVEQTDQRLSDFSRRVQAEMDRLPEQVLAEQFRLEVLGDGRFQPGTPAQYRVLTDSARGSGPAAVQGTARVVAESKNQPARRQVIAEQKFASRGETLVALGRGQPPPNSALFLEVEAHKGKSRALVRHELGMMRPRYVTHLAIDKAEYRQGEILFFRSLTLDQFSSQPVQAAVDLTASLTDSHGTRRLLHLGRVRANGIACGEFPLTSDLGEGDCVLEVSDAQGTFPVVRRRFVLVGRDQPRLQKALKFERQSYQPGDQVRAEFQARDVQNGAPAANRKLDARLKVDGKKAQPLPAPPTNARGASKVEFKLPANLGGSKADVEIRINDGNRFEYHRQRVPVGGLRTLADGSQLVEFFPEGGDLVAGLPSRVYFRVRTALGEPADLEATLVDAAGRWVLDGNGHALMVVSKKQNGLGSFRFTPAARQSYTLRLNSALSGSIKCGALAAKDSGIALSVPGAVSKEGEPFEIIVKQNKAKPGLIATVSSGGRLWDQVAVGSRESHVRLNPPAGVHGILKITVYRAVDGNLIPVAERLVYRMPARRLQVAVQPDRPLYQPGQRVNLSLMTRNEKQQLHSAWLLAAVVDEQALQTEGPPAPFYLSTEIKRAEDLEQADVWVRDDGQALAALDRFLGTQGWRRFAPVSRLSAGPTALVKKDAEDGKNKAAHRDGVTVLRLDNAGQLAGEYAQAYQAARQSLVRTTQELKQSLLAERQRLQARHQRLLAERRRLQERDEVLLGERKEQADEAERAAAALASLQDLPRAAGWVGLSVLVLVLLAVGSLTLVIGLYRTVRGRPITTPYFATAFASLLLCTVLVFAGRGGEPVQRLTAGRLPGPVELPGAPDSRTLAAAPRVDLVPRPLPAVTAPRDASREGLYASVPQDRGQEHETASVARRPSTVEMLRSYSLADVAAPAREGKEKRALANAETPKDLQQRFAALRRVQHYRPEADKAHGRKKADKDDIKPQEKSKSPAASAMTLGNGGGKDVWGVEYAHVHPRGKDRAGPDYQDTVLWSPVLQAADGRAQVSFDLSDNVTTFRILVIGHTRDGRLGVTERRLVSCMAAPSGGKPAKGR